MIGRGGGGRPGIRPPAAVRRATRGRRGRWFPRAVARPRRRPEPSAATRRRPPRQSRGGGHLRGGAGLAGPADAAGRRRPPAGRIPPPGRRPRPRHGADRHRPGDGGAAAEGGEQQLFRLPRGDRHRRPGRRHAGGRRGRLAGPVVQPVRRHAEQRPRRRRLPGVLAAVRRAGRRRRTRRRPPRAEPPATRTPRTGGTAPGGTATGSSPGCCATWARWRCSKPFPPRPSPCGRKRTATASTPSPGSGPRGGSTTRRSAGNWPPGGGCRTASPPPSRGTTTRRANWKRPATAATCRTAPSRWSGRRRWPGRSGITSAGRTPARPSAGCGTPRRSCAGSRGRP